MHKLRQKLKSYLLTEINPIGTNCKLNFIYLFAILNDSTDKNRLYVQYFRYTSTYHLNQNL